MITNNQKKVIIKRLKLLMEYSENRIVEIRQKKIWEKSDESNLKFEEGIALGIKEAIRLINGGK